MLAELYAKEMFYSRCLNFGAGTISAMGRSTPTSEYGGCSLLFFGYLVLVEAGRHGLNCGHSIYSFENRTMPRRGGERTAPGAATPPATVPSDLGYALQYRKPRMAFHETRQALGYLEDLRAVLELTVSEC